MRNCMEVLKAIEDGNYQEAISGLNEVANSYSFRSDAEAMAKQAKAFSSDNMRIFVSAWIQALAWMAEVNSFDERNEYCVSVAKKLKGMYPCTDKTVRRTVKENLCRMHRTLMQQASIFVFRFLDMTDGRPECMTNDTWYSTPFI